MKLKAVIFDFDGVCIDTERARFESWQSIYEMYGLELPHDEWIKNIGTAAWVADPFIRLEQLTGKKLDRDECNAIHRIREKEIADAMPLQSGLLDRLREVKSLHILCAVASSSSHRWVDGHLAYRGITEYFATTVCKEDTIRHKPDPEPYLTACARVGVSAGDAIAIEDSPLGIAAARAAGLYCIAVPCSLTAEMDLSGAQRLVTSLEEVSFADIIKEIH